MAAARQNPQTAARKSVRPLDESGPWAHYVGALEALASAESDAIGDRPVPPPANSIGGRVRNQVAGLRARLRSTPVLALRPTDFPAWIRPSDVLTLDSDAVDARQSAADLGLPKCADAVAAWAALGALAAIVRITDGDGRRDAVIVDESGTKSPLSRWVRALGFAPVELELTGRRTSVEVLDVDTASLDVITRLHPGGCTASDVDVAIGQASWALRSGGLLILTLPIGDDDPDFAVRPADVRGILARADDLGLRLRSSRTGMIFQVGDQLTVEIAEISLARRTISLRLAGEAKESLRRSAPEREKKGKGVKKRGPAPRPQVQKRGRKR